MALNFSDSERLLILKALSNLNATESNLSEQAARLARKVIDGGRYPNITVGVHGGQVQWVLGNPFPIRVCDYDGERDDLPDIDERGQRCRIWVEPADNAAQS